ncbi:MAG: type II toxin-antitoxin system ParD family antitoxin [Verrucomicrobiota bacterium]
MMQLKVSLPEPLREFVAEQAAKSGKGTAEAYVTSLVREARRREVLKEVEAKLIEGLESGESIPVTKEYWAEIRNRVRAVSTRKKG